MARLLHVLLTVCFLSGGTTTVVFAQKSPPTKPTNETSTPRPIEEITVVGQRSLARLRLQIREKEDEIYNFFNAHNSSNRMDIICTKRRPTGTYILKTECEPRFLRQLRVEKTRDDRMGIGVGFNQYDLVGLSAQDFERLQNEMLTLMASNKKFADNFVDLVELHGNLEEIRKAMFAEQ